MLQWSAAGSGTRFMGIVYHTGAEREWAFDRKSSICCLDPALGEAKERSWTLGDMKRDWARAFP